MDDRLRRSSSVAVVVVVGLRWARFVHRGPPHGVFFPDLPRDACNDTPDPRLLDNITRLAGWWFVWLHGSDLPVSSIREARQERSLAVVIRRSSVHIRPQAQHSKALSCSRSCYGLVSWGPRGTSRPLGPDRARGPSGRRPGCSSRSTCPSAHLPRARPCVMAGIPSVERHDSSRAPAITERPGDTWTFGHSGRAGSHCRGFPCVVYFAAPWLIHGGCEA